MEDRLYKLKTSYQNLPSCARNILGLVYSALPARIRYGPFYGEYHERIRRFCESGDGARIASLQLDLLQHTVDFAIQRIPFYRGHDRITAAQDLRSFPIVDKGLLSERKSEFVADTCRKWGLAANTGGSSGCPMSFYLHRGLSRPKEKAHFAWFWGQFGYHQGAKILMVRGAPLRKGALYEYQAIGNRLAISCYALNETNVDEVVAAIREFQPEFIHAYPSALKILTRLIADPQRIRDRVRIKAVFLGSEGIDPLDRDFLGGFYDSRVVSWYGHSECAVHAGNTVDSDEYHFYPFYGYLELLDEAGRPVTRPGDGGRIVVTSFDNYVMPFIRYDTGDIGVLSDRTTWYDRFECTVLSRIEGRSQDCLVLKDGTRVSVTAFIFGQHLRQFSSIREMQLQQDERGELLVRLVPLSAIRADELEQLGRVLRKSVSGRISIRFEVVDRIAKTERGKHRFLIQNLVDGTDHEGNPLSAGATTGR